MLTADPPGKMDVPLNMTAPEDFLVKTSPAAVTNSPMSPACAVGMGRM